MTMLRPVQFGFNNGQTMVDGLYASNTSQVGAYSQQIAACTMLLDL